MLVKNTVEAFYKHKEEVKKHSCQPNAIGAKLLVGCGGIDEMIEIYQRSAMWKSGVQAFAISSKGCYANGKPCNKDEFFNLLMALKDDEDAIIFNVDILTEGLDLPGITGVMPLRNLGLIKLIQLIGRMLRLHKIDRRKLYAGELSAGDYQNYIKPYGFLVVPEHLSSVDRNKEMIDLAQLFYEVYKTTPQELIIDENFNDYKPENLPSMIPNQFEDGKEYNLEHEELSLVDEINLANLRELLSRPIHEMREAVRKSLA